MSMGATIERFQELEGSLLTIPNAISIGALALAVDGVVRTGIDTPEGLAEVGVAFIADILDGKLARALNQDSEKGAAVDAVSDKIKTALFVGALLRNKAIPVPAAVAVIAVNAANAVATQRFELAHPDRKFKPTMSGKLGALLANVGLGYYGVGDLLAEPEDKNDVGMFGLVCIAAGVGLSLHARSVYSKRAR